MITLSDGRTVYASPDDDTQTAFINYLGSAQKRVLIADYSFNIPQLGVMLPSLKNKGVDVRLVLDRSQSRGSTEKPVVATLQSAGVNMVIGTSSKHKIMHDKFVIVDDTMLYGSWNFTVSASAEDNFFVIDPSAELTDWFVTVWQNMYDWINSNEAQV